MDQITFFFPLLYSLKNVGYLQLLETGCCYKALMTSALEFAKEKQKYTFQFVY